MKTMIVRKCHHPARVAGTGARPLGCRTPAFDGEIGFAWFRPCCSLKAALLCRGRQQGTVLVICLMAAALIGIALASYLTMSQQEYLTVFRSQSWNRTMPV